MSRNINKEYPPPGEVVDNKATDVWPQDTADRENAAEKPDGGGPPLSEGIADDAGRRR